jgi:predicted polyphosphate/ATP-dependent NAD kinase
MDADQQTLERAAAGSATVALVLSPIGGQGFVIGRGNAPISPSLVERALPDGLVIVATPRKLMELKGLRFDTGDPALDARLKEKKYVDVVTDYRTRKLVPVL